MNVIPSLPELYSYIYFLADPESGEIRYVGKTTITTPQKRFKQHIGVSNSAQKRTRYLYCWIRGLKAKGLLPELLLGKRYKGNGSKEEIYWIKRLRDKGARLVNLTDGGEGTTGSKKTPEQIKRLKQIQNNRSEEWCRKISIAKKGKKMSDEARQNMSKARKGVIHSLEWRKKVSKANKLWWANNYRSHLHTDETKRKMAEARRRYWQRRKAKNESNKT